MGPPVDVTREQGSVVVVKENDLLADRYIADAEAVILDEGVDDLIKRKATPGLFRMAVEAAAHQRFFSDRAKAGAAYHESDAAWEEAKTAQQRVAPKVEEVRAQCAAVQRVCLSRPAASSECSSAEDAVRA